MPLSNGVQVAFVIDSKPRCEWYEIYMGDIGHADVGGL
jgi:hypothetical protein